MTLGKNQQKSWFRKPFLGFTLVELIVVITILAILGAIGFLSIGGYSSRARDSARVADTSNIAKSLDVSIITVGNYPTPDGAFSVTYSGGSVWNQGTAGNNVMQVFRTSIGGGGLGKKPVDPLDNAEYIYSSLTFGKAYQIQVDYEGDLNATALQIPEFSQTVTAAVGNPTIAYIRGNYGGLTAKTVTGGLTYVLAVPSIITNTGTIAGGFLRVESDALSGSLIFHGKTLKNASYFNPKTVVYSGSTLPTSDTSGQIVGMMNLLKSVYAVSDITSNSNINSLLTTSSTGSLVILGSSIISGQLNGAVTNSDTVNNGTACIAGTYSINGNTPCTTTTAGYYTNTTSATSQIICPVGYYCPTGNSNPIICPSGTSPLGSANVAACTAPRGEQVYTTPGSFTWVVPAGVTSVSVVAVGAGGGVGNSPANTVSSGGGGGALAYGTFTVTPGASMSVVVGNSVIGGTGGASTFGGVMTAGGGGAGLIGSNSIGGAGGVRSGGTGGGNGGAGGNGATSNLDYSGGGGGAGGYSGNGGAGGSGAGQSHQDGFAGSGGGGGGGTTGGGAGGGGGVGIYGQGTSGGGGVRATNNYTQGGFGGSGGSNGTYPTGGNYGAGCGMSGSASGGAGGAVRIIWGAGRAFPSTDTGI